MDCRTHPGTEAGGVCAGCAEAYCGNCLVTVRETRYCSSCKHMAVPATAVPLSGEMCAEATDALKWAVASFVCLGIVLGPMAISKALKAKKLIAENPRLEGAGRAQAAIVLSGIALAFWLLGMMQRMHVGR